MSKLDQRAHEIFLYGVLTDSGYPIVHGAASTYERAEEIVLSRVAVGVGSVHMVFRALVDHHDPDEFDVYLLSDIGPDNTSRFLTRCPYDVTTGKVM